MRKLGLLSRLRIHRLGVSHVGHFHWVEDTVRGIFGGSNFPTDGRVAVYSASVRWLCLRLDRPRRHHNGGDPAGPELFCEVVGQNLNGSLCGRVGRTAGYGDTGKPRLDVDDAAVVDWPPPLAVVH